MARFSRPSPALVISLIALFVALGGTGYAALKVTGKNVKNRSLTGKDVKKNSLRGTEIRESKLGKVPRAAIADSAANAGNAGNAAALGGKPAGAYASADTPGQFISPPLQNSYAQLPGAAPVGYWKGPGGIVHLQGGLTDGVSIQPIFTLPPGFRPKTKRSFAVWCATAGAQLVEVLTSGVVQAYCGTADTHLDGIAFRTDN